MNICDLIKDLKSFNGISTSNPDYETALINNHAIRQHVESDHFEKVFNTMVKLLEPVKDKVGRKYVKTYTTVPKGCGSHVLTFAPLFNGNFYEEGWEADNNRWIARMQLKRNMNSVLIYFPKKIVIQNTEKFKSENVPHKTRPPEICEYEILKPEAFEDFCKKPEDFLCMEKIKERLDRG